MTVTPLGARAEPTPYSRDVRRRRAAARWRSGPARPTTSPHPLPAAGEAGLTVSFEVTLVGASRATDALDVLNTLRELAQRLGTGTVGVDCGPEPASLRLLSAGAADVRDDLLADPPESEVIAIYPESRAVLLAGRPVTLSRLEFDLLLFLAENPRRVFTRVQLLQGVWGHRHTGERTVDVHIRRLRAKLGDVALVTTYRGVGYRLAEETRIRVMAP